MCVCVDPKVAAPFSPPLAPSALAVDSEKERERRGETFTGIGVLQTASFLSVFSVGGGEGRRDPQWSIDGH